MKLNAKTILCGVIFTAAFLPAAYANAAAMPQASSEKFEVSFPASVHAGPITGRVFVAITKEDKAEPRLVAGGLGDSGPLYGVDVSELKPEQAAVIDASTFGTPVHSLREIPAGDYYVRSEERRVG